jgi:hypothetical protein
MASTHTSTGTRITVFASLLSLALGVIGAVEMHAPRLAVYGLVLGLLVLLLMPIDTTRRTESFEDQKKYGSK